MERINPVYLKAEMPKVEPPKDEKPQQTADKPQTDLRVLNDYKRDLVKPAFKGAEEADTTANPLDAYKLPRDFKTYPSHKMYFYMSRQMSSVLMKLLVSNGYWIQTPLLNKTTCPWKMHIYADTEEDWAKLTASVGRYLNKQQVDWKTLSGSIPVEDLNSDEKQKGKAFTVYPKDIEQFKQLAKDIDYIIRLNGLEKEDTQIAGDRQLGSTGRIFYRYRNKSGADKERIYHLDNEAEVAKYKEQYDANRCADKYLAADMTTADDPFYDFDPSK